MWRWIHFNTLALAKFCILFLLGQFIIANLINVQYTSMLGKNMENSKLTMMPGGIWAGCKWSNMPEGVFWPA